MKTRIKPESRIWPRSGFFTLHSFLRSSLCALWVLLWQSTWAGVHYVDMNSINATPPYTNWTTAATNIQDAVGAAVAGDEVVVTNGIYAPINVTGLMTVRSLTGPQFTTISGGGRTRCANLTTNAVLSGFTLTDGFTTGYGGGAYGGTLTNCTLSGNVAEAPLNYGSHCVSYDPVYHFCRLIAVGYSVGDAYGGGAAYCTLNNCTLTENVVESPLLYNPNYNSYPQVYSGYSLGSAYGGGAAYCTLNNCTLVNNLAQEETVRDSYYQFFDDRGRYGRQVEGGGAYRCVLTNCALSNNRVQGYSGYVGGYDPFDPYGAIYVYVPALGGGTLECTLANCTLTGNQGASAYSCTLLNCALTGGSGAGAISSMLNNCTLSGNSSGAYGSTLTNCIVYFNGGANYDPSSTLNYCCTTPLPTNGVGNISSDPQLASPSHLSFLSPCIGKGNPAAANSVDIDGEPWANPPSIGCDELNVGATTGPLAARINASLTNVTVGYPVAFTGLIQGRTDLSVWSFGDGAVEVNQPYTTHSWSALGDYVVSLSCFNDNYPDGISATVTVHVVAGVHYAAANSANPVAPYTSWATAATNIQDAINTVEPGGSVVVSNGIYTPIHASGTLSVRSVNGAQFTIIDGAHTSLGALLAGVPLSGFTLTNGAGGASGGTLNNCIVVNNSGFGANSCTLNNCALIDNAGLGAVSSSLNNCTLTGNSGGGANNCTLNNCIAYFNTAPQGANYDPSSILNFCCTTPQPTNGIGNISSDPVLASAWRLTAVSPCRGAANPADATGTDIDDEPWANPPSIGCDEYHAPGLTGPLSAAIAASFTNITVGFMVHLTGTIGGRCAASSWDFGDGITSTNQPYTSHAWTTPGDYTIVLRAYNENQPGGMSATQLVHVLVGLHYVAAASTNPIAPYVSWATAATNIMDAVDTAIEPGAQVVVTNGTYASGGRVVNGSSNLIAIHTLLSVRSVNGPQFTIINGGKSVRCAYLTNDATLSGFTLTNGFVVNDPYYFGHGGGVFCESLTSVVSNCVVAGNSAPGQSYGAGGGAYGGTLNNCLLSGNSAYFGGGAYASTLNSCMVSSNSSYAYGGGADSGTLNNCTLTGNSGAAAGGASSCTLNNCTLSSNSAAGDSYGGGNGGGAADCTLNNCRLTGNSAYARGSGGYGGGAVGGTLNSCTLSGNSAAHGGGASGSILNNCTLSGNAAGDGGGTFSGTLNNCIVLDGVSGGTLNYCWTADPLFASGTLRLQSNSPCINAGNNSYVTNATDLDGNPRIAGGTVDIGAYEYQSPASMISYAWLQQFNLPIDPSIDTADQDADGVSNYHEWLASTDPTNALSSPARLNILPSGVPPSGIILTWSTNAVGFALQSTTNLASAVWRTNSATPVVIGGQNTVTNPISGPEQFYRLSH